MNKQEIEKSIENLIKIRKLDSKTKQGLYDTAISTLTQQLTNGWIPVSEKLPPQPKENPTFENKPLELYLVSVKNEKYPFRAFWNGKSFTDGLSKVDVEAWQPLPEPYKEAL